MGLSDGIAWENDMMTAYDNDWDSKGDQPIVGPRGSDLRPILRDFLPSLINFHFLFESLNTKQYCTSAETEKTEMCFYLQLNLSYHVDSTIASAMRKLLEPTLKPLKALKEVDAVKAGQTYAKSMSSTSATLVFYSQEEYRAFLETMRTVSAKAEQVKTILEIQDV
jgi:hypothetical protein